MPRLELISPSHGIMRLDDVFNLGVGVEALSGVGGLGLPPVDVQWRSGAGDGSTFRGRRVLSREIDLPLYIGALDAEDMRDRVSLLAKFLAEPCTLRWVEDDGNSWSISVVRTGGGDWTFGEDTVGETDLLLVLTLVAGNPYWTSDQESAWVMRSGSQSGFLAGGVSLISLSLTNTVSTGSVLLSNTGDADAYPVWEIVGPGSNFEAICPATPNSPQQVLRWNGTLAAGETLKIDTLTASVRDGLNVNRYASLDLAPRFWSLPPGATNVTVNLSNMTNASSITCRWRARKWAVI